MNSCLISLYCYSSQVYRMKVKPNTLLPNKVLNNKFPNKLENQIVSEFNTCARKLHLRFASIKADGNNHKDFEKTRKILAKSATVLHFHIILRRIDVN